MAMQLARCGHDVAMWDRNPERAAHMVEHRRNPRVLTDYDFPDGLNATNDLAAALQGAELVVAVVPSQVMRQVMTQAAPHLGADAVICVACKGIERGSLMTMDEVLREILPARFHPNVCALSGPSFAKEVAEDLPTAVVVAAHSHALSDRVSAAFHGSNFRCYHSDDLVGVEVGGAIKNVMAIACGMSDGMGLGLNARAAIITRGLAEITRIAVAKGANPLTMAGLAGMGDLVLTCTGNLSRNRRVGLALGQGRTLESILDELGEVAEGVITAQTAVQLGEQLDIELPISEQVHAILHLGRDPRTAMASLLGRERKAEMG
jgi:glycerol-3-phosphate dehydrogenase (NAD(P)+)